MPQRTPDQAGYNLATEVLTRKVVFTGEEQEYFLLALDYGDRGYLWSWFREHYADHMRHIHSSAKEIFIDGCLLAWETFSRKDEATKSIKLIETQ